MTHTDLAGLNVEVKDGVATVTIDNPPLNLLDATARRSLIAFIDQARDDVQVRVVVFDSADPDFFLAHGTCTSSPTQSPSRRSTRVAPLAVGATSGSAAAWRTTPSTYVIGDQDRVLQPELVDRFAERCDSVLLGRRATRCT